jgi:hypothetical protein
MTVDSKLRSAAERLHLEAEHCRVPRMGAPAEPVGAARRWPVVAVSLATAAMAATAVAVVVDRRADDADVGVVDVGPGASATAGSADDQPTTSAEPSSTESTVTEPTASTAPAVSGWVEVAPPAPGPISELTSTPSGAVAIVDGSAYLTVDGRVWEHLAVPGRVSAVAEGESGWIAAGEAPSTLWTSSDRLTWTEVTLDTPDVTLQTAAVSGTRFVVGGFTAAGADRMGPSTLLAFSSTDGLSFTAAANPPGPNSDTWHGLDDGFVAVAGPALWTSDDGLAWVELDHDATFGPGSLVGAAPTSDGMVAVTIPGAVVDVSAAVVPRQRDVWTSPDGRSWTRVATFTIGDDGDPDWEPMSARVMVGAASGVLVAADAGRTTPWTPVRIVKGSLAVTINSEDRSVELTETGTGVVVFRFDASGTSGTRPTLRFDEDAHGPGLADDEFRFVDPATEEVVFSYTSAEAQAAQEQANPSPARLAPTWYPMDGSSGSSPVVLDGPLADSLLADAVAVEHGFLVSGWPDGSANDWPRHLWLVDPTAA